MTASVTRNTRMQGDNAFKLGLFGMNCSGSIATTAPERWSADWSRTRDAARVADEAGLEFLLPIARWVGYGGATDRQGTSFETLSWASALLASTRDIVVFATVHAPMVHPVFAAKSIVTADHVGRGRIGLNVVSGWNVDEFGMFGIDLAEHDERYVYSREWIEIIKRIWSEDAPFAFEGRHFHLQDVKAKPKPFGAGRPLLMSAGSSSAGRAFAMENVDCLFMVISDEATVQDEIAAIRAAAGRRMGVFASGHLLTRATERETQEYYHYLVHEHGDWEAAEAAIAKRLAGDTRSLPHDKLHAMKERFISGGGTFPVVGSYDQVAAKCLALSQAGLDGMALACVDYAASAVILRDEIVPRLERMKLRKVRAS